MSTRLKTLFSVVASSYKKPTNSIHSVRLESNGKDGFGAKAKAWVEGAQRQTSAAADQHSSVSEGEGVGERGEAVNQAMGSLAKSSFAQKIYFKFEAQRSFSSLNQF